MSTRVNPASQDDLIPHAISQRLQQLPARATGLSPELPQLDLSQAASATAALDPLPLDDRSAGRRSHPLGKNKHRVIHTADGPVWTCGNAVMCGCPDCEAPVSVRLWLMIADCWNCGVSIELSYEQQQAAMQLAEEIGAADAVSTRPADLIQPPRAARIDGPDWPEQPIGDTDVSDDSRARLIDILRKSMSTMPAWVVSMLVHLALLLILALILLPQSEYFDSITISTAVSPEDTEGGVTFDYDPDDPLEYDSPTPLNRQEIERELREVQVRADQDARELLVDPEPVAPRPDLRRVVDEVTARASPYSVATRDPRLRNEMVRREGGTTLTEAAVSRGLRWLASVQNRDGSWSLSKYWNHDDPDNKGDAAATSLALLPFLGASQTHEHGRYKVTVTRGLKWLIDHQESDGDLRYGITSEAGMYAHGQASLVLVEALAMTGDERFREPAQKAIQFIERAQHKHGGWRYRPGNAGDTSVVGWQLMALQSARGSHTGLEVDDATLKLADYFLDLTSRPYQVQKWRTAPAGALYRYLPADGRPRAAMTAEAMLCRMYLGWRRDDPRMMYAVNWLLNNALPDEDNMNLYYYYYATQVMHHYGGRPWKIWNRHLRDLLVVKQQRGGKYPGSWNPKEFQWGNSGGRVYVTALAVCTLEVYYRHLPIFKQLDLD